MSATTVIKDIATLCLHTWSTFSQFLMVSVNMAKSV